MGLVQRFARLLLIGGIVGWAQFTLVYLIEGATRPGYDAVRDAVSALSLTDAGRVDVVSLVLNGVLTIGFGLAALECLRSWGWRWGPVLLIVAGVGLVLAGVFTTDPAQGYPPGTPPGPAVRSTVAGTLHFLGGATLTFGGLIGSSIAFAVSFRRDGKWRSWWPFPLLTALVVAGGLVGFAAFTLTAGPAGLSERVAFLAALAWIAALGARLSSSPPERIR